MDILEKYNKADLFKNVSSEDIDLEEEVQDIQPETTDKTKRKLYVDKVDKSTSDIFRMIVEKELNLQPDYQRKLVWDAKTMSKFIESLLLSIPIPTIFLAENHDDSLEVIDGQQRLSTIFAFRRTKKDGYGDYPEELNYIKELKLTGLDTLDEYNGKKFTDLNADIQRKFNNVSLPIIIIKKDSTEDIKYDIFSRINSGSIKLNGQELLNVMYRGLLLSELNRIANTSTIDDVFGYRPILKKRFGYHEILLRAKVMDCFISGDTWKLQEVAIHNKEALGVDKTFKKYNGRLNTAVMEYLKEYRNDKEEAKRLDKFIENSVKNVKLIFGEHAFKRVTGEKSTSINKTIAELQLVVLSRFNTVDLTKYREDIYNSFSDFLKTNSDDLFTRGTNNTSNVEKRYGWGIIVSKIIRGEWFMLSDIIENYRNYNEIYKKMHKDENKNQLESILLENSLYLSVFTTFEEFLKELIDNYLDNVSEKKISFFNLSEGIARSFFIANEKRIKHIFEISENDKQRDAFKSFFNFASLTSMFPFTSTA